MNILWIEYRFVLIFCSTMIELYNMASTLGPWEWLGTFNHLDGDIYTIPKCWLLQETPGWKFRTN